MEGRDVKGKFVKGHTPPHKGKEGVWSKSSRERLSATLKRINSARHFPHYKGSKNPLWKGDKVSYSGLHRWVRANFGTPSECEHCGADNLQRRQYHWSNKSGDYKRDREDWQRLCVKCHKKYDARKK